MAVPGRSADPSWPGPCPGNQGAVRCGVWRPLPLSLAVPVLATGRMGGVDLFRRRRIHNGPAQIVTVGPGLATEGDGSAPGRPPVKPSRRGMASLPASHSLDRGHDRRGSVSNLDTFSIRRTGSGRTVGFVLVAGRDGSTSGGPLAKPLHPGKSMAAPRQLCRLPRPEPWPENQDTGKDEPGQSKAAPGGSAGFPRPPRGDWSYFNNLYS